MKYYTNLKIEKSKFDLLLDLLKNGSSIEDVNNSHGTNYEKDEDIFSKIAYFEDGSYAELLVYTGSESIMCSLYLYKDDKVIYVECDEGFEGDCQFEVDCNFYNVCVSSVNNEFIKVEDFSELKDNGIQEYFNVKCNEGSIDVLKNKDADMWFGILHYTKSGDLLIPNINSVNSDLAKQLVCDWYNENFQQ